MFIGNPSNYLGLLDNLKPGETLELEPGTYGANASCNDFSIVPGLPIYDLNGTPTQPITIKGRDGAAKPIMLGNSAANIIRFRDSSYVVVKGIEVNGRKCDGFGVSAEGSVHHVTLEDLYLHDLDGDQAVVGISSTGALAWNWTVRHNLIDGAGTGIYFGNSTGGSPFVAGLIEHNVFRNTIGYNMQVKHQVNWGSVPAGMPTGATKTIIRHNVFSKSANSAGGAGARPNLLIGDQPPSGAGSSNSFEIYGNFFYQNPTESLFQGEGNFAFYNNLLVHPSGDAINVQTHNGAVRTVRIFSNTIVASGRGITVSGGAAGTTQRVQGNAVFAASPIAISGADATQSENVTGSYAGASNALNNPTGAIGSLNLYPKTGQLSGTVFDSSSLSASTDFDRDFNGTARTWTVRGAYTGQGTNPGWTPALDFKP